MLISLIIILIIGVVTYSNQYRFSMKFNDFSYELCYLFYANYLIDLLLAIVAFVYELVEKHIYSIFNSEMYYYNW